MPADPSVLGDRPRSLVVTVSSRGAGGRRHTKDVKTERFALLSLLALMS